MKELIDIRVKLITTIITIFFIVSVNKNSYNIFLLYFILSIIIAILFRPNFLEFIKRLSKLFLIPLFLSIFIPFANKGTILYEINLRFLKLYITDNGLATFYSVLIKAFLSLFLLCALITSTEEKEIFWGLRKLYVPKIVVSIIFFMYRYLFLFKEEFDTGKRAINSRMFKKSNFIESKKTAYLVGNLFIRTFNRADNIFMAMQSRGFDGNFYNLVENPKINFAGLAVVVSFVFFDVFIRIINIIDIPFLKHFMLL